MNVRVLPSSIFLLGLGLAATLHELAPGPPVLPEPFRIVGFFSVLLGFLLNFLGEKKLKEARTPVNPFEAPRVLVTDGIFRRSRNPMYLGMELILCGFAVLSGHLFPWLPTIAFPILVNTCYIAHEERKLGHRFKEEYKEYCVHVRRWV